jgi:hypothetical protein
MDQKDTRSSVVIIEAGAGWPTWISEYQRRAPQAAVVAQAASDPVDVFRERVVQRVNEIAVQHQALHVGILVCGDGQEPERTRVRREICSAIVNALDSSGDFVLAANEDCDERFKHELLSLAGELCEERAGTRVNVRVRFSTGRSGTMPSVVPTSHIPSERNAAGNG